MRLSLVLLTLASMTTFAMARDNITITGSSTVYPYTSIVAENYVDATGAAAPVVESVGTGAGVKMFCSGIGDGTADIVGASRPMKQEEIDNCKSNGVEAIEIKIGYDGIVFASDVNGPDIEMHPQDVYKALAANLVIDGKLVPNPYKTLNEINPELPDWPISFYIPGEKHGTREVFEKKVLEAGCNKEELIAIGVSEEDVVKQCIAVRKDGLVSDIAGDYSETMARITADPHSIGIFGFSYYIENTDKIKVATVMGIAPSLETIASGEYPVSRPLFIYVKQQHIGIIVGLTDFLKTYVSDESIGPDGSLPEIGLIPLSDEDRIAVQELVDKL